MLQRPSAEAADFLATKESNAFRVEGLGVWGFRGLGMGLRLLSLRVWRLRV